MFWVLYALSTLFVLFENKWIVHPQYDRPAIFFNQTMLWVLRVVFTYGTLAGIWFAKGFWMAAIAFAAFYAFNKLTFGYYYSREINVWTAKYVEMRRREQASKQESIDESQIIVEARELAIRVVSSSVKGENP